MSMLIDQVRLSAIATRIKSPTLLRYISNIAGVFYVATWTIDQAPNAVPHMEVHTTQELAMAGHNAPLPADF